MQDPQILSCRCGKVSQLSGGPGADLLVGRNVIVEIARMVGTSWMKANVVPLVRAEKPLVAGECCSYLCDTWLTVIVGLGH